MAITTGTIILHPKKGKLIYIALHGYSPNTHLGFLEDLCRAFFLDDDDARKRLTKNYFSRGRIFKQEQWDRLAPLARQIARHGPDYEEPDLRLWWKNELVPAVLFHVLGDLGFDGGVIMPQRETDKTMYHVVRREFTRKVLKDLKATTNPYSTEYEQAFSFDDFERQTDGRDASRDDEEVDEGEQHADPRAVWGVYLEEVEYLTPKEREALEVLGPYDEAQKSARRRARKK